MQITSAMRNGITLTNTFETGTPTAPESTKASIPTGGVTSPISMSITIITPNHIGSQPIAWTSGYITGMVRITAEKKDVRICATDLEVGINCVVSEVQIEKEGEVVIPADRLAAIVRESIDDVLAVEADEGVCRITGADSHFTIYGHDH